MTGVQVNTLTAVYDRIFEEIRYNYVHKYNVLRNLVFELLRIAFPMQPTTKLGKHPGNGFKKIATIFLELSGRQFPVDENHKIVSLRSAFGFASQLNIDVNHLNKAVKAIAEKTTLQNYCQTHFTESKNFIET